MNLYGYEFQRESDLMHYGVMGMKWGIRRYQNPDGTLTAEGQNKLKKDLSILDKKQNRAMKALSRKNFARLYYHKVGRIGMNADKFFHKIERRYSKMNISALSDSQKEKAKQIYYDTMINMATNSSRSARKAAKRNAYKIKKYNRRQTIHMLNSL